MLMGTPCQQSNLAGVTLPLAAPARVINRDESEHACRPLYPLPLSEIIVRRSNVRKRFDLPNATDGTCKATLAPSSTLLC